MNKFFRELEKIPEPKYLLDNFKLVIENGKRSNGLKELAQKYRGPKYDPTCMAQTGAIGYDEGLLLYRMVRFFKPTNILEIGTWYGTSAMFMFHALRDEDIDGTIYTCDKNNLYVCNHDSIEYHNCLSTEMLKRLQKEKVKINMVFTDGRFFPKDERRIKKLMPHIVFATHDYKKKEKGWRNVKALEPLYKDYSFYQDKGIMAFLIDEGIFYATKSRNISAD